MNFKNSVLILLVLSIGVFYDIGFNGDFSQFHVVPIYSFCSGIVFLSSLF